MLRAFVSLEQLVDSKIPDLADLDFLNWPLPDRHERQFLASERPLKRPKRTSQSGRLYSFSNRHGEQPFAGSLHANGLVASSPNGYNGP